MLIPRMFAALVVSVAGAQAAGYVVYAGTYSGPQSKGIYAWKFDPGTGTLEEIGAVGETSNPSFLALHPTGKYLYAVNEVKEGTVTAFAVDSATGKLTVLNSANSRGSAPCHLTVDKSGRNLLVANYSSGTVAAIRIGPDGKLGESTAFDQHKGSGPNQQRQREPHAHSINLSANQRYAIAADLGTDELVVYRFNPAAGTLKPHPPSAKAAPGAGPRHFAFHPTQHFAYAINELNSTIAVYRFDPKSAKLTDVQTVSTLPQGWTGENTTAEVVVHPNGRFVYGSNRGHDSIATFAVDKKTGKLALAGHTPSGGRTPRNFAIDPTGRYLFAANQASNNIVVFKLDPDTGALTPAGTELKVSSPVCVRFLALR